MSFKNYLEPDLLGTIQLVPQFPLCGHCNLSEIIKTVIKNNQVKVNEQGTPNISSEISLSYEMAAKAVSLAISLKVNLTKGQNP